jgi:phosphoglycolate phosphatase
MQEGRPQRFGWKWIDDPQEGRIRPGKLADPVAGGRIARLRRSGTVASPIRAGAGSCSAATAGDAREPALGAGTAGQQGLAAGFVIQSKRRSSKVSTMSYSEQHMIRTRRGFDPHSIKLVIFDLDGTLIDSRLDLVHSVNAALRHIGRSELPDHVIASYVGDGAPVLIQRALGGEIVDEALVGKGLEFFLTYYRAHKLDHTTVYPGIAEALAAIQNSSNGVRRKLAVLSNKPVGPSRAIIEELGLGKFFSQVYGGNSFETKKPDPEGARKLLEEAGARAEQAAIVGDSHTDIETGKKAGLWTVGATYGFAPQTLDAASPDVVVDHPGELAELFSNEVG